MKSKERRSLLLFCLVSLRMIFPSGDEKTPSRVYVRNRRAWKSPARSFLRSSTPTYHSEKWKNTLSR